MPKSHNLCVPGLFCTPSESGYWERCIFLFPPLLLIVPLHRRLYENLMCVTDQSRAHPRHGACTSQRHLVLRILCFGGKTFPRFFFVFAFVAVLGPYRENVSLMCFILFACKLTLTSRVLLPPPPPLQPPPPPLLLMCVCATYQKWIVCGSSLEISICTRSVKCSTGNVSVH